MLIVALTAFGVGGATVLGAIFGFLFKKSSAKTGDVVLGFAAGVMMAASVVGLITPSLSLGGKYGIFVTVGGILAGTIVVGLLETFIQKRTILSEKDSVSSEKIKKILLLVAAIAIHNLPEGIAAGVGFGGENVSDALVVAASIALQNFPEGMAVCAPMIASGFSKKKTFFIALGTGLIEVVGTFVGYFAVTVSKAMLPFSLAFAGGTMVYVISDDIIPETHLSGNGKASTFALIIGFVVMLTLDWFFG